MAEDRARRLDKARQAQASSAPARSRKKQRRKEKRKDHKEARTSTVDPQARIMKMADGSFRPAYNVQFNSAAEGAHIVGISVTDCGSDHGQLGPALDEIKQRYGVRPKRVLADGGYTSKDGIEKLHAQDIALVGVVAQKQGRSGGAQARRQGGDHRRRQRMASEEGITLYPRRFATERPHV